MKVSVEVDVPDEVIRDVWVTAVEQGINYWCDVTDDTVGDVPAVVLEVFEPFDEDRNGDWVFHYRVPITVMGRGFKLWAKECPRRFNEFIDPANDWDHDAGDADVVFQLGAFGEVVYG